MNKQTKQILSKIITVVMWILIARVIVSWIRPLQENIIGEIIYKITDPIVAPVQAIIPPMGGIDLSVLAIYFLLRFIQTKFLR